MCLLDAADSALNDPLKVWVLAEFIEINFLLGIMVNREFFSTLSIKSPAQDSKNYLA